MADPRILLLQARKADDPAGPHEVMCFSKMTGASEEQITSHDLLEGPPSIEKLKQFDALMVGGSGDYYISKGNLPHFESFLDFLRSVVDLGFPTMASCFGFQGMVLALGGGIVHDVENIEVGSFELELTEEGRKDELFGFLPDSFLGQLGRKDRASSLPGSFLNLAKSSRCPYQAFRVPGKAIWGSQFHPELDLKTNRERYIIYSETYSGMINEEDRKKYLDNIKPSPESNEIPARFMKLLFG